LFSKRQRCRSSSFSVTSPLLRPRIFGKSSEILSVPLASSLPSGVSLFRVGGLSAGLSLSISFSDLSKLVTGLRLWVSNQSWAAHATAGRARSFRARVRLGSTAPKRLRLVDLPAPRQRLAAPAPNLSARERYSRVPAPLGIGFCSFSR